MDAAAIAKAVQSEIERQQADVVYNDLSVEELEGVEYLVSSARGFEAWAHAEADKGRGVGMARSALVLAAVAALVAVGVAMATTHLRPS